VPTHWDVSEDYPSATRFWVEPQSGTTSWECGGDGWTFSEALKQWHLRQAERVWAGRRLVARLGRDAATRRTKDLQTEPNTNIRTANSYLDLLVSIGYEACRLTHRAELAEQMLVDTTRRVMQVASFLGCSAQDLTVAGVEAVSRAQAAAHALDELAETLKQSASPLEHRFEPLLATAPEPPGKRKEVCEWVRYATPSRNYRKPDLNWLVASAVVTYQENKPDVSTEIACQRVSGYLAMLDAPFGSSVGS